MCDYSLYATPNRLVIEGEQLVVHKFPMGSLGLASAADVRHNTFALEQEPKPTLWQRIKTWFLEDPVDSKICAVCVPPGAHLILKGIPGAMQQRYGLQEVEGVVFTQIGADANSYRDAVRFNNGSEVRLQELQEGQLVEVLSLAAARSVLYEQQFELRVSHRREVLVPAGEDHASPIVG